MNRKQEISTFKAAEELGVSIRTVQQWMEKGVLKGRKTPGGHRRIDAEEVRMLAAKRRRDTSSSRREVCKVLIIEDDPDICRLYELMSCNWHTPTSLHFAHDGFQGLIAMGEFKPDFVVLDLNIPLIDGFQLIRTLSEKFDTRSIRYCVVTGLTPDEIEKRGQLPKGCPILAKPINFPHLEKLIAEAYREVSTQRANDKEAPSPPAV
jgi:excisionase family DNA binding protein